MTEKSSYQPGEPSWVDLSTPDMDRTVAFYEALFGWTFGGGSPEFGGYGSFFVDGKSVAGVLPLMAPGQPPVWTTYLSVADADATVAAVTEHGGQVFAPAMDVGDLGRMAVFADPTGAAFGIWQASQMTGFDVTDEIGTFCWSELSTRDRSAALPFYSSVFGLEAGGSPDYTELNVPGNGPILGCMDMPDSVPEQVPAYWMPYFAVVDPAAAAQQAASLGATVVVPIMDMPQLSCSVVADPHGSLFGLLHLK